MKKKVIAISDVTGIFIIGLCIKLIVGSRDVPVIENAAVEESIVSDGINEQSGQEKTEAEVPEEIQRESKKPEELVGILNFGWTHYCYDCIRVDADTLLFASDCYFADEKLQQKIFFLAEAPDFNIVKFSGRIPKLGIRS